MQGNLQLTIGNQQLLFNSFRAVVFAAAAAGIVVAAAKTPHNPTHRHRRSDCDGNPYRYLLPAHDSSEKHRSEEHTSELHHTV